MEKTENRKGGGGHKKSEEKTEKGGGHKKKEKKKTENRGGTKIKSEVGWNLVSRYVQGIICNPLRQSLSWDIDTNRKAYHFFFFSK